MPGQSIALATKGIIFCPQGIISTVTRCVIPFNLRLTTDLFKLNLKKIDNIKLNLLIQRDKLNLIKLTTFKLNSKLSNQFKLNLKVCEDQ